jgi:peptidoglycan/xylan/chitin deacetylase (PgdA/CDA1 family)
MSRGHGLDADGVRHVARTLLHAADRAGARLTLGNRAESPALLAFAFHHLFENKREIDGAHVDPYQPIDVRAFECFLEYFLERDYTFVSTNQVVAGLAPGSPSVLVTFDDGYSSALRAAEVLRRYAVPATFFISSTHVAVGKAFWWDVLYRERTRQGVAAVTIHREKESLLGRRPDEAEAHVKTAFGEHVLKLSRDEVGRPMTDDELRELALEPLVTLGNHTADHAILTGLEDDEVRTQIARCQQYLASVTGTPPEAIAYPNGDCSRRVAGIARSEHLRLGLTAVPRKNRLPLVGETVMALGRYFLDGDSPVVEQCRVCCSDIQLLHAARRVRSAMRPVQ